MLINAFPANATPLPVVRLATVKGMAVTTTPSSDLAEWAASIGRLVADTSALMFRLPIPGNLRDLFEDTIRQEVTAGLLHCPEIDEDECRRLEDIAWLAFDRRLARHAMALPSGGEA